MTSTPYANVSGEAALSDPRSAHLVRYIGHVLLMRVDSDAAKALNLTGYSPEGGTTDARAADRLPASHTDGGDHG